MEGHKALGINPQGPYRLGMAPSPPARQNPSTARPTAESQIEIEFADLRTVAAMARLDGPFVSVLLRIPVVGQSGADARTEWGSVRHELALSGADRGVLKSIERFVSDLTPTGHPLYILACEQSLGWRRLTGGRGETSSFARVGQLPVLAPLIDDLSNRRPVVGAVVDRGGIDIFSMTAAGDVEVTSVDGNQTFINRVVSGGWSQRRRQARTDLAWERNAADFATRLSQAAEDLHADHFLLTGDEREVRLVRRQLEPRSVEVVAAGGRNEPATVERMNQALLETAGSHRAQARQDLFDRLAEELGQADHAVAGPEATLEHLNAGSVETLLVAHDLADDRRAWFGDDPQSVSMSESALPSVSGRAPLVDVAIRAALHTDASTVIVGPGDDVALPQGIGALLRYVTEP